MLKILQLFFALIVCSLAVSCTKKTAIKIESLNKAGSEFYFGEKVPVWASTSGDKNDITYQWSATGGTFDDNRASNLFENLWVAPATPGEYTITATAKGEGGSSSKTTTMKVTRYYFDEFQSAYTLNGNGWSQSNTSQVLKTSVDPASSSIELTASATNTPNFRRTLNLAPLKIPFSIRTRLGWKTFFRDGQPITISLFFNQPVNNPTIPFLREIRWEIWPTANPATTDNYQVRYETFIPASNTSVLSADGNAAPGPLALISPTKGKKPELALANGQLKNFSFSVDAGNVFHAYIDGDLWFTSNGIKDWLDYAKATYAGFEDPVAKEYRVTFPGRQTSGGQGSTIVLKSVYINNDGEILK